MAELVGIDHSGTWRGGAGAFHFAALTDVVADAGRLAPVWLTLRDAAPVSLLRATAEPSSRVADRAITHGSGELSSERIS